MAYKLAEDRKEYNRQYHLKNKERIQERVKSWYKENRDLRKDYRETYKDKANNRILISEAKSRAKANSIPFDLEADDVCIPEFCPVLKVPLKVGVGKAGPFSPSLDRIDPNLGYVKGNVQVISLRANRMKNDATREELISFAEWVIENYGHPRAPN